jgi:RNA polymerase sigma factor (sigma-70 family)
VAASLGARGDLTGAPCETFIEQMPNVALPPFQELLDEHGSDVLGFLIASVGPNDAEDCFQETFIAALRAYPRLEHARNLRSWLLTIAHRKAIDHHRARGRRALPSGTAEEVGGGIAGDNNVASRIEQGGGELWQMVSALPPKQRSAVVLRYAADMSYRGIGEMLDSSEEAARRNVHEGLQKLRGELR